MTIISSFMRRFHAVDEEGFTIIFEMVLILILCLPEHVVDYMAHFTETDQEQTK